MTRWRDAWVRGTSAWLRTGPASTPPVAPSSSSTPRQAPTSLWSCRSSLDGLAGGRCISGSVAENHCWTDGSASTAVGPAGGACHGVTGGEQAGYGSAIDMQDAAVAVGPWSALGAHRSHTNGHRIERGGVDRAQ